MEDLSKPPESVNTPDYKKDYPGNINAADLVYLGAEETAKRLAVIAGHPDTSVTREGASYKTYCPAHDDNKPSLSVSDGKKGNVYHCQARGCDGRDIIAVLKQLRIATYSPKQNGAALKKPAAAKSTTVNKP